MISLIMIGEGSGTPCDTLSITLRFSGYVLLITLNPFLGTKEKSEIEDTYLIEFLYSANLNVSGYQDIGTSLG